MHRIGKRLPRDESTVAAFACSSPCEGSRACFRPGSRCKNDPAQPLQATTLARSVSISISSLATATIDFNVANANTLFASVNYAFNDMASYMTGIFDMGIPFFYGRHVYYGITGTTSAGGGTGPYVAFTSS
jgi:hypothetical protein